MNKFYTLLLFVFSYLHECFCQQPQTDSLYISTLKKKTDGPAKIKELIAIAHRVASYNPQEAVKLSRYVIETAKRINDKSGVASGYNDETLISNGYCDCVFRNLTNL